MEDAPTIEDYLKGAIFLLDHSQFQPAGYYTRRALFQLAGGDPTRIPDSISDHLVTLAEDNARAKPLVDELSVLDNELKNYLRLERGYIPGFIQKKTMDYVDKAGRLYQIVRGERIGKKGEAWNKEELDHLETALGVIIRRVRQAERSVPIREEDFRDLFGLREKVQLWAPSLVSSFPRKGCHFHIDSISRINPTSGYIWVAFIADPARSKVEQASYSLTFTPPHLRAGLVLGGRTHDLRKNYYQKFLKGELDDVFAEFVPWEGNFLDIFWYFNPREKIGIRDYLEGKDTVRRRVQDKLRQGLQRISREKMYNWDLLLPSCLLPPSLFSRDPDLVFRLVTSLAQPVATIIKRIEKQ